MNTYFALRSSNPFTLRYGRGTSTVARLFAVALAIAVVLPSLGVRVASAEASSPGKVWISYNELLKQPTSGAAWDAVASQARASWGKADVSDQNSNHDVYTLAGALYAARTGDAQIADKTRQALRAAVGTEQGGRWLAVGRNVGAYVIAADVMRDAGLLTGNDLQQVSNWIASFLTMKLAHNNNGHPVTLQQSAWVSGSNASAQEGFVHAAVAAYVGDSKELTWAWNAFRRYAGDRSSPHTLTSNDTSWQHIPTDPVGIQDAGSTKRDQNGVLRRMDGAIGNDMSRGGSWRWIPGQTSYPWVGLEGAVPAAVVLGRAGYPAWEVGDRAIFRALDYLWFLTQHADSYWWKGGASRRAEAEKHLGNLAYAQQWPVTYPTAGGRTIGFTDWTHTDKASLAAAGQEPEPKDPELEPEPEEPEPAPGPEEPVPGPSDPQPQPGDGAGSSTTVMVEASADAYISSERPNNNYGAADILRLRTTSSSKDFRGLVNFDVEQAGHATLRLYVTGDSPDGGAVRRTATGWSESTVTWNNAPAASGPVLDSLDAIEPGQWVEFDVGEVTQGANSFILTTTASNSAVYSSKEGDHAPQLVVIP